MDGKGLQRLSNSPKITTVRGRAGVELQQNEPRTSRIITTPVTAHTRCGQSGTCHGPGGQILHSPVWAIHSTSSFQILSVVWDSLSTSWESFFWIFQDLQKYTFICVTTNILARITAMLRGEDKHAYVPQARGKQPPIPRYSGSHLDLAPVTSSAAYEWPWQFPTLLVATHLRSGSNSH